jgi:hypothetical protein
MFGCVGVSKFPLKNFKLAVKNHIFGYDSKEGVFGTLASRSPCLVGQGKLFGCCSPRLFARQACSSGQENPCQRRRAKLALPHGQGQLVGS